MEYTLKEANFSEVLPLTYNVSGMNVGLCIAPRHVETQFTRTKSEPKAKIVPQGKYECAAAALAMLIGEPLFHVKRAMAKHGWRNDNKGACDLVIRKAAREFGRDLLPIKNKDMNPEMLPSMITVPSLNLKGRSHAVTWNGEEILDPNWGYKGRKWWGTEWAPWTMKPHGGLMLLNETLTQKEREELDEFIRSRDKQEIDAIKNAVFAALQEK